MNKKGFTLTEIILVILLVGVLSLIASTAVLGHVNKTKKDAAIRNAVAYVKFAGINSDTDLQKFYGWEILADRKYCKPLKKDEWYIEDLKNCSLVFEEKNVTATSVAPKEVGTITDVMEGGAGYLLEVSLSENCDRKVLVPFNKEFIGKVDVKNKTVQLMHLWILE